MARRFSNLRPGTLLLAATIAIFLWGVANGQSERERVYDVPVELHSLNDELVVTDQSVDAVNIRVKGSPASLRNIDEDDLRYPIDLSGAKRGELIDEVPLDARLKMPRNVKVVSRSPSRVSVSLEPKARRAVDVRADVVGEPAPGYRLVSLALVPQRVYLAGARSDVLRFTEVVTETIDLSGLQASEERPVGLLLGGGTVWQEGNEPVKVVIQIEPEPVPPEAPEAAPQAGAGGKAAG